MCAPANHAESDADGSTDALDGPKRLDQAKGSAIVCGAAGIVLEDHRDSYGRNFGGSIERECGVRSRLAGIAGVTTGSDGIKKHCFRWAPLQLRRSHISALVACAMLFVPLAHAQETVVNLDPAQTKIELTVDSTLHTVHGTFKLKSGTIHFDPATGKAGGSIVVDATSGDTDNTGRDKKMHQEILESPKFPEVTFTPNRVQGTVAREGSSNVQVSGVFRLHGLDHDMTLNISVTPGSGGRMQVTADFGVPFIDWGLKDPSTFILHVNKIVNVHVTAIMPEIAAAAGH
jgi:polyisoprenoid-binding protein YceI